MKVNGAISFRFVNVILVIPFVSGFFLLFKRHSAKKYEDLQAAVSAALGRDGWNHVGPKGAADVSQRGGQTGAEGGRLLCLAAGDLDVVEKNRAVDRLIG